MGFKQDIEQAKSKLQAQREALIQQIGDIDIEIKDYDTALRVARKLALPSDKAQVPSSSTPDDLLTQNVVKFIGSIKTLTYKILKYEYPKGMQASDIRTIAQEKYDVDLNPNTLTVTLGRLKGDGFVRIDGRVWFYVPKGDRQQAPHQPKPMRRLNRVEAWQSGLLQRT